MIGSYFERRLRCFASQAKSLVRARPPTPPKFVITFLPSRCTVTCTCAAAEKATKKAMPATNGRIGSTKMVPRTALDSRDELRTDATASRRMDPRAHARLFSTAADDCAHDGRAWRTCAGGQLPLRREEAEARRTDRRHRRRALRCDLRLDLSGECDRHRPGSCVGGARHQVVSARREPLEALTHRFCAIITGLDTRKAVWMVS